VFNKLRSEDPTLMIQAALDIGEKAWNRSKIMLVGEGRAGKTALAKSFMGLGFTHTESTCGIEQFRVEVTNAAVGEAWLPSDTPGLELEAAIVALLNEKTSEIQESILAGATVPAETAVRVDTTSGNEYRCPDTLMTTDAISDLFVGPVTKATSTPALGDGGNIETEGVSAQCYITPQTVERIKAAMLSKNLFRGSDLVVRLFDFAGQDIFNCLHTYFLTRHGVYVIVFDMNWLAAGCKHFVAALENISFWLNSVAVNTRMDSSEDQKITMAPVFLVGSHKDQVSSAVEHVRMSDLLRKTFSYSAVWQFIVENEEDGLVYFPVDNKLSFADTTMVYLMALIEQSIRCSDYISIKRPLQWYSALDAIQELSCPTVSLSAASELAVQHGVRSGSVTEMLEFFRDMGMVMWYDEPELRDSVILDPIAYFVKPVTRVICHTDMHNKVAHQRCRKLRCKDFDILFTTGVASPDILKDLLGYDGYDTDTLILLMMKYGLAMCWREKVGSLPLDSSVNYFIPALFPAAALLDKSNKLVDGVRTIYMLVTLDEPPTRKVLRGCDLPSICFFPKGLFDRLLSATLVWCHETGGDSNQFTLCKWSAILQAAGMWFRMSWVSWSHCICLDVAAEDAGPSCEDFINELWRRWRVAAAGGMQSITMAPFVPYMGQPDHHLLLVPFRGDVSTHTERSANGFHCFLSYRWGKVDKLLVTALYEHLTGGMVRGHTMRVFLDDKVFRIAEHFRQAFVESILTTEVFVPINSTNALDRMTCHNPQEVDNLLV
jgi:GTPase SAR1 family protein